MKKILNKIVVQVCVKDVFKGSGILYRGSDSLYLFTAAHCIFGLKGKDKTKVGDISIVYNAENPALRKTYNLKSEDILFSSAVKKKDFALVKIKSFVMSKSKLPKIMLGKFDDSIQKAFFKGFPMINKHKNSETVNIDIKPFDSKKAFIVGNYKSDFSDELNFSGDNVEGFSGSGLFEVIEGNIYLLGVVTDIRTSGQKVKASRIDHFAEKYFEGEPLVSMAAERIVPDGLLKRINKAAIRSLGPRYTPKFTFRMPIYDLLDSLGGSKRFQRGFFHERKKLSESFANYLSAKESLPHDIMNDFGGVKINLDSDKYPFETLKELLPVLEDYYRKLFSSLSSELDMVNEDLLDDLLGRITNTCYVLSNNLSGTLLQSHKGDRYFLSFSRAVGRLWGDMEKFSGYLNNTQAVALFRGKVLFVSGNAGSGKSHMLADTVKSRNKAGQLSLFILGQDINSVEGPWGQILAKLGTGESRESFLKALNQKAKNLGSRAMILVDAINEGGGLVIWKKYLTDFLSAFTPYSHISVVLTYRTTYHQAIFGSGEIDHQIIPHEGLKGYENEAMRSFFSYHKIALPDHAVFQPAYSNPLFLTLLCIGLKRNPEHYSTTGFRGISMLFEYFSDHVNEVLGTKLNYTWYKLNMVSLAIERFVSEIVGKRETSMDYQEAFLLIHNAVQPFINKKDFLNDLVEENLFIENLNTRDKGSSIEINFGYQQMGDYLIAAYLLNESSQNLRSAFKTGGKIYPYLDSLDKRLKNKGILEALTVILPEKYNVELFDLWPTLKYDKLSVEAYFDGFSWRKYIDDRSYLDRYLKKILKKEDLLGVFFSASITQSSLIRSQINGFYLSEFLKNLKFPELNATWTVFLNRHFKPGGNIENLIKWAWKDELHKELTDYSFLLSGSTLIWFFSSTNRNLRDNATKAAINLLRKNNARLIQLLKYFGNCNDPYVFQRLYAVAYGCSLRVSDEELTASAKFIYEHFFDKDEVLPDILTRDYARSVIELVESKGIEHSFDLKKIRPPYNSKFPSKMPTNSVIDKRKPVYGSAEYQDGDYGLDEIFSSMVTEYGRGVASYGDFGRYTFESAFRCWKSGVDANKLSNLVIKWILDEYGYNPRLHGRLEHSFDRGKGTERLGKKYQWIAFFKLLALVSDNKPFYSDGGFGNKQPFRGPWEPMVRDIDPTFLQPFQLSKSRSVKWLLPPEYSQWSNDDFKWIRTKDDLPDPTALIQLVDKSGVEWLILEVSHRWTNESNEEDSRAKGQEIWHQIRSYLVETETKPKVISWLKGKSFYGRWMPESDSRYQLFNREYYWSPAMETFKSPYYGGKDWVDVSYKGKSFQISPTAIEYNWDTERDKSNDSRISMLKPSRLIHEMLNLDYSSVEGKLINPYGELLALDPSVTAENISCLVVRKKPLLEALKNNGLSIFWTVLGEKRVLGLSGEEEYPGVLSISHSLHFHKGNLKLNSKIGVDKE